MDFFAFEQHSMTNVKFQWKGSLYTTPKIRTKTICTNKVKITVLTNVNERNILSKYGRVDEPIPSRVI